MLLERATDMDVRKAQPASFYPKLQLGLLVCGVLMLASLVSMQFMMLRGFSQLADDVNSKSQGLESLSRFGELNEPVQQLLGQGKKLLDNPASMGLLSAVTNPWTVIQLFREGVPYLLSAEAMPGLLALFDKLQSADTTNKLRQFLTQTTKIACFSHQACEQNAADFWPYWTQNDVNRVHAWARMLIDAWPTLTEDEEMMVNNKKAPAVRTCNSDDVWEDLVCTVEIATQQFEPAEWTRTAQRCLNIVQRLRGRRWIVPSFWEAYGPRGWNPNTPADRTQVVNDLLARVERGCRLFV